VTVKWEIPDLGCFIGHDFGVSGREKAEGPAGCWLSSRDVGWW
jgi:hypothetical protein